MVSTLLPKFASMISSATPAEIILDPTLAGRLNLEQEGALTVTYAPFDYINSTARVVLVGITPGRQQAVNALLEAQRRLAAGRDLEDVAKGAKETASFSGGMRSALIDMLNYVGIHRWLGITSCASLFSDASHLVHYTSALRYPVYIRGENYSDNPAIGRTPILQRQVLKYLAEESQRLPNAVWVPLGPVPASALALLSTSRTLDQSRVLEGLPHPSGANGERIAYFLGRKAREQLSPKTSASSIDAARSTILARVKALQS